MKKTKHPQPRRSRAKARPTKKNRSLRARVINSPRARRARAARRALPIRKRFLLHPLTVMIILIVGVFIIGWTYEVIADSYSITGTIAAPPLEEGAIITSPDNGAVFTTTPITVSGTCPDESYINLYRNNTYSGTAWCSSGNTWQIITDLSVGENDLLAQDFNVTDQPGPTTPAITVTYSPVSPVTPTTPTSSSPSSSSSSSSSSTAPSSTSKPASAPLLLTSDFHYQTFAAGTPFTWVVNINGGVSPYSLIVDWGDGSASTINLGDSSVINLSHIYSSAGYFAIILHASDSSGEKATLQLAALIRAKGATGVITFNTTAKSPPQSDTLGNFFNNTKRWLWIAWPAYLIILLMLISFWLGEKEEYQNLFKRGQIFRGRRHAYRRR